ncbi:uncharacterized protein BX664DRAFT_271326 [Halteromyces radiatus]|uniref:uncharacterized protein n=1 Tax=Halteromyces radiatus TaxID=101107 RepID=UPI00221E85B1|nr:uncharacterized protein BX664DRAFT_271326 [Halteromyces radiatus]KAI8098616.1 hypothetical protein BX664DRAFT_271326 [Halteromyces radiatus]
MHHSFLVEKRQQPTCPPCFNCQLQSNPCTNGGSCDPSGICSCPAGWGDVDCSTPLCGSLYDDNRPQRPSLDQSCSCDDGWAGVNCNVCQHDLACQSGKSGNATCIKSAIGLKSMHAWCATTNIPWIDNTKVSLQCDWGTNQCVFQFWKDQEEQFYCEMSECTQHILSSGDYDVHGQCAKSKCGCMKDAFMCGREVDMSELVKNVKGPSEWYCKDGQDCWYNEYSTLVSVFPDNINLACDVGECVNEQDYLDVQPVDRSFSRYTESMIALAILLACVIIYVVTRLTAKRQKQLFGTQIELTDDNDDDVNMYLMDQQPVQLTFENICYNIGGEQVLSNVTGYTEPGHLMAVMGPSGAGKSTLLDILARKHKRGVTSGRVLVNGTLPDRKLFKRMTGYVDQDDTLMGTLTVRETLMYSALLRLPRKMPMRAKYRRVQDVMKELGIDGIADHMIGIPGQQRGISGGEKRRVSIGKALVTNPQLLFLDEPTSGLDAYNASMVMSCLKRLCRQGSRTIILTIHQPRSNIFKLFDSLLLLATGKLVYFGPANATSRYFNSIGYSVPSDYNIADYFIDLTMKRPDDTVQPVRSSSSSIYLHETDEQLDDLQLTTSTTLPSSSSATVLLDGDTSQGEEYDLLKDANHTHHLFESYKSSTVCKRTLAYVQKANGSRDSSYSVWVNSNHQHTNSFSLIQFWHELSLLSSRTFINLYRNPFLFFAHFVCSLALGVLLGSLFWQVEVDLTGVQNRLGVLFFMCALLGFASTSALDMFSKERLLFMRERENGYYSPASYFVAKVVFDVIPLRVLPPLVMGAISYFMIGLNPTLSVFLKFLLVLVLFNLAAAGLCLCFATAFKNLSAANLLANLVMLFSMLFGGFLLNKEHIPGFLSWLQYLSFFNYGYEALIVNELKDITLRDKTIADIQIPGPIILARFGFNGQAFWRDVARLVLFVLVTMTSAFCFLKYMVKEKR